jgi:hypothetical protein
MRAHSDSELFVIRHERTSAHQHYITAEAGALYIDIAQALQKHGLQFDVNTEIGSLSMGSRACCGSKDASMPGEFD